MIYKNKYFKLIFVITIIFVISISFSSSFASDYEIKISHSHDETHPVDIGFRYFKDLIEDISNGSVEVLIYPNSELGNDMQALELVRLGSIQMSSTTCAELEEGFKEFDIFGLPFLFRDYDHLWDVTRGPLREILQETTIKGNLKLMGITTSGARQLFSNRPINNVEDVKNLTLRAMSVPSILKTWELLGARPVPVAWDEVYSALQTGIVEGSESSIQGWYTLNHYEHAPYGTYINYMDSGRVYYMNLKFWNDLPEKIRIYLQIAWDKTEKFIQDTYKNQDSEIIEEIEKSNKGSFTFPDVKEFQDKLKPIYQELEPTLGLEWVNIIQNIY